MDLKSTDIDKLDQMARDIKKKLKFSDKIKAKIAKAPSTHVAWTYAKEQAEAVCHLLNDPRLEAFPNIRKEMEQAFRHSKVRYDLYLIQNEFGAIVPDYERLEKLILT